MSAHLPSVHRARFQRYIEEGLSGQAAALRLKISPATGALWARQVHQTGRVDPAPQGRPRGMGKLAPHALTFKPAQSICATYTAKDPSAWPLRGLAGFFIRVASEHHLRETYGAKPYLNSPASARGPKMPLMVSSSMIAVTLMSIKPFQSNAQLASALASFVSQIAKPPDPSTLWYLDSMCTPSGGIPPVAINFMIVSFRACGE